MTMKSINTALTVLYGLGAAYFLYMAAMGIFVYFANRSMGHTESFLVPGQHLVAGLFLCGFAYLGWRWLQNPGSMGIWGYSLYLPAAALLLFVLWFVILHLSSGGRWN
jgi:hypothetical protein